MRAIIPSLASVFSQLIKDSSLASVIAVAELTYQASAIEGQTFRTFEVYITVCVLYLVLVTLITQTLTILSGSRGDGFPRRAADA
jgi:ABC-type amino acid transport system permease subunit